MYSRLGIHSLPSFNLLFCFLCSFLMVSCTFFEVPPRTARNIGTEIRKDDPWWLINATDKRIKKFVDFKEALCPGLVDVVRRGDEDDCPSLTAVGRQYDTEKGRLISEFLHISDAQIRDESLYETSPLDLFQMYSLDNLLGVTIRRPLVEKFDSFTLAAFLVGYEKGVSKKPGNQFVVHTGDLLDISVATELMDGLSVFKNVSNTVNPSHHDMKVFSVAGNHDGLVFGNIPDGKADGRGLDVNKAEFIFAHLLESSDEEGFGFGKNEILQQLKGIRDALFLKEASMFPRYEKIRCACKNRLSQRVIFAKNEEKEPKTRRWCQNESFLSDENTTRFFPSDTLYEENWWNKSKTFCALSVQVLERLQNLRKLPQVQGKVRQLNMPITYRKAIDFPGSFAELPLKLGYYSWTDYSEKTKKDECKRNEERGLSCIGVRYIVLDTRNNDFANGTMDWVQLGWVYNELRLALASQEVVIVFSHDAPDEIPFVPFNNQIEYQILVNLLHAFPNVAAVFYGHGHHNENKPSTESKRFASFQTGSLADFPQVGREVEIYVESCLVMAGLVKETKCKELETEKRKAYYQISIQSRFVRPRGDFKKSNGFFLESILRASRRDAEKEDRTKAWRKLLFPFIPKHGSLKAHEWPYEPNSIIDKNGVPIVMNSYVHFDPGDPKKLSPSKFFREGLLCKINNTRLALGLSAIKGTSKGENEDRNNICRNVEE